MLTADAEFDTFRARHIGASERDRLVMVTGRLAEQAETIDVEGATVVVVDLDAEQRRADAGAGKADGARRAWPPVIAVTQSFDETVARTLMQMRVADFLVKPVAAIDLVRACARVGQRLRPAAPSRPRRRFIHFCPRSAAPA